MQTRHLTGPGELIAAIPQMLGRSLDESVVVVGLDATGAVVGAWRVDRADAQLSEVAGSLGREIASQMRACAARRAFMVSFTFDDVSLACPAIDALRPQVATAVERIDAWSTDGERYRSPGCADAGCCPDDGHRLPLVDACMAPMPAASAIAHAAADDDGAQPPAARRRSAARAADRWRTRKDAGIDRWRRESWTRLSEAFPLDAPAPALGRAIACVGDVRVRDALIVEWLGGADHAVQDVLEGRDSAAVADVLDGILRDPDRPPPEPAAVVAALRWCRRVLAHARLRERAPLQTLCAVLLWCSADLGAAEHAAQAALRTDPEYTLAALVCELAYAGITPAWSRDEA